MGCHVDELVAQCLGECHATQHKAPEAQPPARHVPKNLLRRDCVGRLRLDKFAFVESETQ